MRPTHRARHPGFTLVELLLVIAIIAIFIAVIVPAVQRVREAELRTRAGNNLWKIGWAVYGFHDANKRLPFNGVSKDNMMWLYSAYNIEAAPHSFMSGSWAYQIFHYMNQGDLFANPAMHSGGIAELMCPGRGRPAVCRGNPTFPPLPGGTGTNPCPPTPGLLGGGKPLLWSDYGLNPYLSAMTDGSRRNHGTRGQPGGDEAIRAGQVDGLDFCRTLIEITDGTSFTALIGQMSMDPDDYTKSTYINAAGDDKYSTTCYLGTILHGGTTATSLPNALLARDTQGQPKFAKSTSESERPWGGPFKDGVLWVMCDGSVRLFPYSLGRANVSVINPKTGVARVGTFAAFMTPTGGEKVVLPE